MASEYKRRREGEGKSERERMGGERKRGKMRLASEYKRKKEGKGRSMREKGRRKKARENVNGERV